MIQCLSAPSTTSWTVLATSATDQRGCGLFEDSWVRSVYLYVMCAASVVLVVVGLSTAAIGLVHTVAPDLGHRDAIDRIGIGLSNVGGEVVDLFNDSQLSGVQDYCSDVTESESEFDECVEDEQVASADSFRSIEQGIAEVKDELNRQIRNSSIDGLIRGILMVVAGVLLFRIHGRRTELFADGLVPRRRDPEPVVPPTPSDV